MTFDPFKVESGLLDNVDVTVLDALFTRRPDSFDNGQTLELHLTLAVEGDEGGEQVQYFRCGDGWDTLDDGVTAVREDGKERGFHENTKVGELFHSLVKVMAEDKECDKELRERVSTVAPTGARDTRLWKGLKLHLDREDRKGGGEVGDYQVLVVSGFNGVEGTTKAGAKAAPAKAAGAAKKAPAKAAAKAAEVPSIDTAILATLDTIADESEDHDGFMERAFAEIPEATSDETIKAAVMDDAETGDGVWARAMARYEAGGGGE